MEKGFETVASVACKVLIRKWQESRRRRVERSELQG
jgi:hypothetical protein